MKEGIESGGVEEQIAGRRTHQVFVTRNTEYHVRERRCIGVRDRESGHWIRTHFAVDRVVAGAVRFFETGSLVTSAALPTVGDSLYFEEQGRDLVTSSIIAVI